MFYEIQWLDIYYEGSFRTPAFELARSNVNVLETFFERINPRYTLATGDMQALGGNTLADVRARISLFNGNGVLELGADKFTGTFRYAGEKDIAIVKDCLSLSLDALTECLPGVIMKQEIFRPTAFLSLKGAERTASEFLGSLIGNTMQFDLENFGASGLHSGLKIEFENQEQKWLVSFDAYRSFTSGNMLIVGSNASYQEGCAFKSFDEKVSHVESMFEKFLKGIGLEPQPPQ